MNMRTDVLPPPSTKHTHTHTHTYHLCLVQATGKLVLDPFPFNRLQVHYTTHLYPDNSNSFNSFSTSSWLEVDCGALQGENGSLSDSHQLTRLWRHTIYYFGPQQFHNERKILLSCHNCIINLERCVLRISLEGPRFTRHSLKKSSSTWLFSPYNTFS